MSCNREAYNYSESLQDRVQPHLYTTSLQRYDEASAPAVAADDDDVGDDIMFEK